jgi:hypothetical protein
MSTNASNNAHDTSNLDMVTEDNSEDEGCGATLATGIFK